MHYTLQAEAAAKKGTTVIDVRPANEYKRGRIPGAVNCEFYRPITGKHWVLCTSRHCMRWCSSFGSLGGSLGGSLSCQKPA